MAFRPSSVSSLSSLPSPRRLSLSSLGFPYRLCFCSSLFPLFFVSLLFPRSLSLSQSLFPFSLSSFPSLFSLPPRPLRRPCFPFFSFSVYLFIYLNVQFAQLEKFPSTCIYFPQSWSHCRGMFCVRRRTSLRSPLPSALLEGQGRGLIEDEKTAGWVACVT